MPALSRRIHRHLWGKGHKPELAYITFNILSVLKKDIKVFCVYIGHHKTRMIPEEQLSVMAATFLIVM